MNTAQTIFSQLGGNRFAVMTGAKNLMSHGDAGLSFQLQRTPHYTRDGINYAKITLNELDLYDMEFGRIHGLKYTVKRTLSGVYAEDLCRIFSDVTGLDTHL